MVKVGDYVKVYQANMETQNPPIVVKVIDELNRLEGEFIRVDAEFGGSSLLYKDDELDIFEVIEGRPYIETPKVGDTILIYSYGYVDLEVPHVASVEKTDVDGAGQYVIWLSNEIRELPEMIVLNQLKWEFYDGAVDDDYPIPPSYAELASRGMTLSEYVGEEMSAETLNFKPSEDIVTEPSHYNQGKFETIEMIQEITDGYKASGFIAHCVGTAVKYLSRAPYKSSLLTDLKKARQYITFAIEYLEGER